MSKSKLNETDAREVIERLRGFEREMTTLLSELDVKPFDRPQQDKCRRLYTDLKQRLREAADESSTLSKEANRNEVEKAFFDPAVGQALCELTAATNSNPFNSNWHSLIYAARIDINHLLRPLEERFPE